MKTITKLALGGIVAASILAWQHDRGRTDERQLELVLAETGRDATCTRSEVDGHDWMACRYGDADQGPVWIRVGERDGRPLWTTANGPAIQVLERYLATASSDRQAKLAQVRPREPGEDLPGAVPWERLN
jgi:hypothetical protein